MLVFNIKIETSILKYCIARESCNGRTYELVQIFFGKLHGERHCKIDSFEM